MRVWMLIAICSALVAMCSSGYGAGGLTRIAILPLDVPQEYRSTPLSRGLTDMITTALVKAGGIEVVERAELDKVLRERDLKATGVVDSEDTRTAASVLGVDYLITGRVTEFGIKENRSLLGGISKVLGGAELKNSTARVALDIRIIDASDARVVLADTGRGEDKSSGIAFAAGDIRNLVLVGRFDTKEWAESRIGKATRKAVGEVIDSLLDYFPAVGKVSAVFVHDGKRFAVLDRGAFAGLKEGQEFQVFREEPVLGDDGSVVWTEKKNVGTVRVVELENDRAKAAIVGERTEIVGGDLYSWQRQEGDELGHQAEGEKISG